MFDDSDDFIESWCTVCDKQILQPRSSLATLAFSSSLASSSSTSKTATATTSEGYKKPPGKYIAPKPPTFKRSKTGTIRAKPPPNALVSTNPPPSNPSNGPPPTPAALRSSSGPLQRVSSAGHLQTKTGLLSSGPNPTGVEGHSDSSPATPTPSNPRTTPPATIITTLPTPPSHHQSSGLFCSYACAQLEEERSSSALAPLLSSALSFSHTSPLHTSWTAGGGPPSPFSLSNGSDSEGGEYFDGVPGSHRAGREGAGARSGSTSSVAGGVGGTRRGSRSTNTTGSSSDSLQSLWDKDNAAGAAVVQGANHPYHGLKRMTPLVQSKSELDALPPFTVRPISAQNLIPPPPTSPHLFPMASPRRSSSSSSFSSTGMAFRSSSHSSHRASLHGPTPSHLNPSSYSMSPPLFEPGSAPSTASLYASYAEGFNRTPSAESKLAMYGGRMASPRRGKFYGLDDGHEPSHLGGGGARPTNMLARRSSDAPSEDDSDSSSTRQPQQTTPTQSILHRPTSPTRRSSSSLSTSLASSHRYSSSTSSLAHQGARPIHPPTSRPPPSKNRLSSQKSGASTPEPSQSWSWSSMEKMYEVPRVASAGGAGGGSSSLGGSKLFYWGGD